MHVSSISQPLTTFRQLTAQVLHQARDTRSGADMSTDGFRHWQGVKSFGRKQDLRVFSLQVEVHCGSLCSYKAVWIAVTADHTVEAL